MPHEMSPGKPTTRRYSEAEKDRAVRMVLQLRKELKTEQGTVKRVAEQLGVGVESLRGWVKRRGVDEGLKAGDDLGGRGPARRARAGGARAAPGERDPEVRVGFLRVAELDRPQW